MTWSYDDEEICQEVEGYVRMTVHLGGLHFIPTDDGKTIIKQVIKIDPNISLPSFVLKHTVSEAAQGLHILRGLMPDFVKRSGEFDPVVEQ